VRVQEECRRDVQRTGRGQRASGRDENPTGQIDGNGNVSAKVRGQLDGDGRRGTGEAGRGNEKDRERVERANARGQGRQPIGPTEIGHAARPERQADGRERQAGGRAERAGRGGRLVERTGGRAATRRLAIE